MYIRDYQNVGDAVNGLERYFDFYNHRRLLGLCPIHSSHSTTRHRLRCIGNDRQCLACNPQLGRSTEI